MPIHEIDSPPPIAPGFADGDPGNYLWIAGDVPFHRNRTEHEMRLLELGVEGEVQREEDEMSLKYFYDKRLGHAHRVYGNVVPPMTFRLAGGLVGPVMGPGHPADPEEEFRYVFLDRRTPESRGYASAWLDDGREPRGVLRFASDVGELMRLADWLGDFGKCYPPPPGLAEIPAFRGVIERDCE
ncbi:MAG: hypothetical protein OXN84_00500 [Albidovulum sp.]|nr:hypothetical protein [Albidovulum sp.]